VLLSSNSERIPPSTALRAVCPRELRSLSVHRAEDVTCGNSVTASNESATSRNSVSVLTANRFCARTRDESSLLTRDDDFFARMNVEDTVGIPFQKNQTLSARKVVKLSSTNSPGISIDPM
jgi:hypothetical protein